MDAQKLNYLLRTLQRIFALPITKSTFRDVQNVIMNVTEGNSEQAQQLLEDLVNEKIDTDPQTQHALYQFGYLILVAKDVFERGDFLGLVTSDTVSREDQVFFSNRIRRIDGTELHFVTDVDSTVQLMNHLLVRLSELKKLKNSKDFFKDQNDKFTFLAEGIKALQN